ncbi:MAG: hypothetical protein ACMUIA_06945 [bacterium]
MSKQVDKIFFWLIMVVIVSAIGFLSYVTFLSETSHQSSKDRTNHPNTVTKEAEELYICLEGARIRSLPQKTGKTIYSPQVGEKLLVMGEKEEWFQVGKVFKQSGSKAAGWIEKKYVCDQPPKQTSTKSQPKEDPSPTPESPSKEEAGSQKPSEKAAPPQKAPEPYAGGIPENYPGGVDSFGSIENLLEALFNQINSLHQMQYAQVLFDDYQVLDGGMRLEVRATGLWSLLPQGHKVQVLNRLSNQYFIIACNITRIVNCTPDLIPGVSIINSSGREIAYQSSSGSQILE